jgi:hypothetical protein
VPIASSAIRMINLTVLPPCKIRPVNKPSRCPVGVGPAFYRLLDQRAEDRRINTVQRSSPV